MICSQIKKNRYQLSISNVRNKNIDDYNILKEINELIKIT